MNDASIFLRKGGNCVCERMPLRLCDMCDSSHIVSRCCNRDVYWAERSSVKECSARYTKPPSVRQCGQPWHRSPTAHSWRDCKRRYRYDAGIFTVVRYSDFLPARHPAYLLTNPVVCVPQPHRWPSVFWLGCVRVWVWKFLCVTVRQIRVLDVSGMIIN